jgi:glutamate--cysteine ligase
VNSAARAEQWIRDRLFPREPAAKPMIGAEVELLAFDVDTRCVSRLDGRLGAWLRDSADRDGWRAAGSTKDAPLYHLPDGMTLTLEPGGQIEFSSPPHASTAALIAQLQHTGEQLTRRAHAFGIELHSVGIDPFHDLADAPLQLDGSRYARMDRYFATIGNAGARMMRQTAALQLSVDAAHDPALTWSVLNRAAPVLTALFANSRIYNGRDSGYASCRARQWRELDDRRTGVFHEPDAVAEYARFALDAPFIGDSAPYPSFRERARDDGWEYHVSTLFPEVRPKGYYEVRCMDAIPIAALAAPVALISAIAWDQAALQEADALLPVAYETSLERAARCGMSDRTVRALAEQLVAIASEACVRMAAENDAAVDVLRDWLAQSLAAGRPALEDDLVGDDHVADHTIARLGE